ncbi:MAG TPA: Bax inhibitor-1/YccA family protein [Armatimonadota bacterium]|nr:Bax inhibitor-1/YccA family protein [Armatimonadota bacterium]
MLGYRSTSNRSQLGYVPSQTQQHTLIQRVSYLVASGLLVSALSSYAFRGAVNYWLGFMIAMFALIFVMRMVARKPGINVLCFYLFSVAMGGMLGPLLMAYVKGFGADIVWESFLLTAIAVIGIGGYAYTSGKDFGFLGRFLFWALLALIIVGVLSWFVVSLNTPLIMLGYDCIGVAIFTGFLLYDFSNIRLRYSPEDYTIAATQVYLDFVNLFLFILNILAILQGGGGTRRR